MSTTTEVVENTVKKDYETILKEDQPLYKPYDLEKAVMKEEELSFFTLFKEITKQIRPGVPLYRLLIPSILLSPVSQLEKATEGLRPYGYFRGISECKDPGERFLRIIKWKLRCLSTHPHHGVRTSKPYNPIIGEIFRAKYAHEEDSSETNYFAEQVSHHPPVSAYHMNNKKRGTTIWGTVIPNVSIHLNSVTMLMKGRNFLKLDKLDEVYEFNNPAGVVIGIVFGKTTVQFYGKYKWFCKKTGWSADFDFAYNKGNKFKAVVKKDGKGVYSLDGVLTEKVFITDLSTKKRQLLEDYSKEISYGKYEVKPLHEQKENESRRVWHMITKNIIKEDFPQANFEKVKLEERQRAKRKIRKENNEKWVPKYFETTNGGDYVSEYELKDEFRKNMETLYL